MAAFALAASITPGPVNIVALNAGARHGLRASQRHVAGATIGFTLLLLLTGLGLHELLARWPVALQAIRYAGIGFLLFMAWKLASADGRLPSPRTDAAPSFLHGAALQWLNPKAWLAAVAGMGAFAADGDAWLIGQFAALYFVICYASVACWAWAGALLQHHLHHAGRLRWFNRLMAAVLAASAAALLQP